MKNILAILIISILLLFTGSMAQATLVTLKFDPNDILNLYPSNENMSGENKATQANARRVHQEWATTFYETFYNPTAPHLQPNDYNTYVTWRNSLNDEGEGIAVFNSWFLNGGAASSWGETVVNKPGTSVSATAADGWGYNIIVNPYDLGGSAVQWYTLDPAKRLRPTDLGGADIGLFTITADLYYDLNGNGWDASDPGVTSDDYIRFWVGNLNGDDPEFYRSDTQAIFFDNEGGATFAANYSSGAGSPGSGFEGVLTAQAEPVPEPATMLLLGSGILGLAGFRKKMRKN